MITFVRTNNNGIELRVICSIFAFNSATVLVPFIYKRRIRPPNKASRIVTSIKTHQFCLFFCIEYSIKKDISLIFVIVFNWDPLVIKFSHQFCSFL